MLKLNTIAYSKFSNKMIVSLSNEIVALCEGYDNDELLVRQTSLLATLSDEMALSFSRNKKSPFTKKIEALEDERKKIVVALRASLVSSVKQGVINPAKATLAQPVLDTVKTVFYHSYGSGAKVNSAEVASFLDYASNNEEVIVQCGLQKLVKKLQEVNDAIGALYLEKAQAKGATVVRSQKAIRIDLEFRIRSICNHVHVNAVDLPDEYGSLLDSINSMIMDFRGRLRKPQSEEKAGTDQSTASNSENNNVSVA